MADETGQEVSGCGFGDQAALGEDEADEGVFVDEADVHGEGHCDADAH